VTTDRQAKAERRKNGGRPERPIASVKIGERHRRDLGDVDALAAADFQNPDDALSTLNGAQNLKFERADWTSFRTVEGLQQKAGVTASKLRRLVLKELTDNALDTGAKVRVGELIGGGYFIEDKGPGIGGTPEEIARLFSIARPMISTKLLRLPTRGALGNGLRVVAGAVLASDGTLTVITRNHRIELRPERDGSTTVVNVKAVDFPIGTRIQIGFGPAIPEDKDTLYWAKVAIMMQDGPTYAGKSSPYWYDVPQFHELLSASGNTLVRELVANLDGCSGGRAGEIVAEAGLVRAECTDIDRDQAKRLLLAARASAKPVTPKRLGAVGPLLFSDYTYAIATGTMPFGAVTPKAGIPFAVEAWAKLTEGEDMYLTVCVNRTPVTGEIYATRDNRDIDIYGCGLGYTVAKAPKDKSFEIWLNITTPYMPITSDGKEPNLEPFLDEIKSAVAKAVNKTRNPSGGKQSQKDVVLDNLDAVIDEVSGDGEFRFNARQLFYALRPIVMRENDEELKLGNFTAIITDYESEYGEIPLMYREPRGSITHPHRNETITLGTLMVEEYERPEWTFNKLVYIEKEGANEALKAVGWPEKHDCAVMSSKGFSTRAAKDLIDKLVEHDEPIEVFCVHDADAYGTMIYQTLQEETKARKARKIKITNFGLEPWEAVAMGLEVETVEAGKRHKAVADYVLERGDGDHWDEWLQTRRVELNAMTTPQFITWLDAKMAEHGNGKLIPPDEVIEAELAERLENHVRADLTEQILREADLEGRVAAAIAATRTPKATTLVKDIKALFKREPAREWRDHIKAVVAILKNRKGGKQA
jgi:hypothetical protein